MSQIPAGWQAAPSCSPSSVVAFRVEDYAFLEKHVTADRVKGHFRGIVLGEVVRHARPGIGALNFVPHDALKGRRPLPGPRRPRQGPKLGDAQPGAAGPAAG